MGLKPLEATGGIRPVVLVVDDDPGIRESFRLILEDSCDVLCVPDGGQALETLRSYEVDLVLLDIRLPDMDGIEVLERIRALDEHLDVILVTAVQTVRTAVAAMKLGAFDYLTKPFEEEEILSVVRRALEKRALDREVAYLRTELARQQLEEQLRRSERLAALGTLAAGLAHEIKNPLTSLLIFAQQLSRKFEDRRFRQNFETVVPRELERINRIVEGLLQLARPTRLNLEPVHVPDLLERALELYANQIETKRITVVREYVGGLPPIEADAEHLYRALVNLVANALDAMGEGGRLTLRAGWSDGADPFPAAQRGAPNRRLKVEIEDTGKGIASSQATKIFNPFFTTKPGGTGLGLAIAHKVIEDHGGTISVRSTPGSGTTVSVRLPLSAERKPWRGNDEA